MRWIKPLWHFVLRHLPRWLHIAAHEVEKAHKDCPDCRDYPYMDYSEYCRDCDLYQECKDYDEHLEGGA